MGMWLTGEEIMGIGYDKDHEKPLTERKPPVDSLAIPTADPWVANDKHSDSNYPWRIESDANGYPNDGYIIAKLEGPDAEANAKLIAAAPALLQELQNIANAKPSTWDDPTDFQGWAQSRARFAISKVLG